MYEDGIDLWIKVTEGDLPSFNQLYHRYASRLMSYGLSITSDRGLVKDSIQNVFVTLWQRRYQIKIKSSLPHYLITALRRDLLDQIKRSSTMSLPTDDDLGTATPSRQEYLVIEEEARQLGAELKRYVALLTPRQREVLHLKYKEGMDNDEIAGIIGIKKNGVYRVMYTAIAALRKKML